MGSEYGPMASMSGQAAALSREAALRTVVHECQRCGKRFDHGFTPRCPTCTGLVETLYDLQSARIYDDSVTSRRFADLLPIQDRTNLLRLGEGGTPCVHARRLGERLGLE